VGRISVLLNRYARIRGELAVRSEHALKGGVEERQHAIQCAEALNSVKQELEKTRYRAKLPVCANLLGMADRDLVSLYPSDMLAYRLRSVRDDLSAMTTCNAQQRQIQRIEGLLKSDGDPPNDDILRTALKDALAYIHGCDETALIEDDLQVTRLTRLLQYLVFAWVVLLLAIPIVSGVTVVTSGANSRVVWPVLRLLGGYEDYGNLLVASLALSVVGAVGGIISGAFGVRDSRAVLEQYRTSMLKLLLKPMVGAIAALTLYLFLSADVISGIQVTNGGIYIVVAFLAGFSERYFLRVVRAQEESLAPQAAAAMNDSLPSAPRPAQVPRST
jgi:hypothetical protein